MPAASMARSTPGRNVASVDCRAPTLQPMNSLRVRGDCHVHSRELATGLLHDPLADLNHQAALLE